MGAQLNTCVALEKLSEKQKVNQTQVQKRQLVLRIWGNNVRLE